MERKSTRLLATTLVLSCGAIHCAGERGEEPKNPSYETLRERELESERTEFIQDRREQIAEVSKEIGELKGKLEQRSATIDEPRRAKWSNSLFELEQERNQLVAELDRAQDASDAEWKEMRGALPVAVDSLQAGVRKLGNDIGNVFSSEERKVRADSGLCSVAVSGVDTEIEAKGDSVLVEITTNEKQAVGDLQQRAQNLGQLTNYRPAVPEPGQEAPAASSRGASAQQPSTEAAPIPLRQVAVQNIDDGVRITFVAASDQRDQLREQISEDAERLTSGDCQTSASPDRVTSN